MSEPQDTKLLKLLHGFHVLDSRSPWQAHMEAAVYRCPASPPHGWANCNIQYRTRSSSKHLKSSSPYGGYRLTSSWANALSKQIASSSSISVGIAESISLWADGLNASDIADRRDSLCLKWDGKVSRMRVIAINKKGDECSLEGLTVTLRGYTLSRVDQASHVAVIASTSCDAFLIRAGFLD